MTLPRKSRLLWLAGLVAVGLGVRLYLAFHFFGNGDIWTFALVGGRARETFLHLYSTNIDGVYWPYGPGYLPWLVGAYKISDITGLAFQGVVQLAPIAADMAIAALVYAYLGIRGAPDRVRIAAFGVVMLGPAFIAISGYHGQLDPVAILPGVAALLIWETRPDATRAFEAGILLGIGGALKTVPLLLILPMVISSGSMKQSVRLVGAAVLTAFLICLPFYLAEPAGFRGGPLEYSGVPGRGGLSLIFDPVFAADRRLSTFLALAGHPNGISDWISMASGPITLLVLGALAWFLWRYRPEPVLGAVLLWLSLFVFSPNFLLQYLVWAMPFFLMAGYVWQTMALQVAVVPALLITYLSSNWYGRFGADLYVVLMSGLWVFWVVALVWVIRTVVKASPRSRSTARPVAARASPGLG